MVVERVPRMAHKDDDSDSGHEQDGKTQVQSDSSEEGFVIPAWRLHMPVHCGNFVTKTPMLGSRSDWAPGHVHAPDWRGNNNTLGEWGKCFTGEEGALPQHLADTFTNTSLKMLTAQQPEITEKIHADAGYSSPKEDGRKSSEHTNSYDVSASQSPSNDGGQSDSASDEQIDVECMTQTDEMETDEKEETMQEPEIEVDNEVKTPVPAPLPAPIAIVPVLNGERKPTIEEALLLSLQQHQFQEVIAEAAKIRKASAAESLGFVRSGTSAFSNIEPKEAARPPSVPSATPIDTPTPTVTFSTNSSTPTSASFCRPPGLGPVALPPVQNGQTPQLVCPICGFMCPSKFHFNSHMNTHGDHQCSMCDYTSRTEGRLKKHMRESHTQEEQLRAGLELEPVKETNGSNSSPKGVTPSKENGASSPISEPFNLSTTMASILDSTNNAIAAISHTDLPSSLPTALNLDITSTPTLLSTLSQTSIPSSALDQIKAFAENTNLMPENGISLASALGAVSQAMKGEPASPEKQSNGESRRSSSGKMKILKCKQCGHHSMSKDEQWAHARTHIPTEKQLNCQHCNFVTEYKHHLEYHYRNHIGSKPFQCKKCSYTCVNKSMLNSHMKSHTNHYQFRCMDCTYATKYCHSLKLHLKKYNHRRVPEGIDLSGGDTSPSLSVSDATISFSPSLVKQEIKSEPVEPVTPIAQPFSFNPMVGGQGLNLANQFFMSKHLDGGFMGMSGLRNGPVPSFKCPVCDVVCSSQEEQMRHSMSHILNTSAVPTTIASLYSSLNLPTLNIKPEPEDVEPIEVDVKIEDDSSESHAAEEEMMDHSSDLTASPAGSSQTASSGDEDTKKCKTMSMEQLSQRLRGNSPMSTDSAVVRDEESADDDAHSPCDTATSASSPPQNNVSIVAPIPIAPAPDHSMLQALIQQATMAMAFHANRNAMFTCHHCNINFGNQPAYTSHMAAHSFESPFKCNKCGHISTDSLSFALHQFQLCRM